MKIERSNMEMTSSRRHTERGMEETRIVSVEENEERRLENSLNEVRVRTTAAIEAILTRYRGDPVSISSKGREYAMAGKKAPGYSSPAGKDARHFYSAVEEQLETLKSMARDFMANPITFKGAATEVFLETRSELHYEAETTGFNARGSVETEDGREVSVSLDLMMNRELHTEAGLAHLEFIRTRDPLVINTGEKAAELTSSKYLFDLDSDGEEESISFLKPGSGFLALDKNNDGIVNNGKELFGPDTGSGFGELAAYDAQGNGWIDENDPVFERLRVWSKDESGNDRMQSLESLGIGAISLDRIKTAFDLKDETGTLHGKIRESGIYLREDGKARTVQEIDLTV